MGAAGRCGSATVVLDATVVVCPLVLETGAIELAGASPLAPATITDAAGSMRAA
jgi:hypothetical protein